MKYKKRSLTGGRSGIEVYKFKEKVYKLNTKDNDTEVAIMKYFNSKKTKFIPKFFGINKYSYKSYSFVKGKVYDEIGLNNKEEMINAIKALNYIHAISKSYTKNDNVILHNDFTQMNVVFNKKNEVVSIIDWDKVSIGNRLSDISYFLIFWPNIGSSTKSKEKILNDIDLSLSLFQLNQNEKDILFNVIFEKVNEIKNSVIINSFYERTIKWADYCIDWLISNKENLEKIIKGGNYEW